MRLQQAGMVRQAHTQATHAGHTLLGSLVALHIHRGAAPAHAQPQYATPAC